MEQTEGACNAGLMRKVTCQINDTLSWLEAMGCQLYTTGNTRPDAPAPIAFKSPSETGELGGGRRREWRPSAMRRAVRGAGRYPDLPEARRWRACMAEDGAVVGAVANDGEGDQEEFHARRSLFCAAGSFESGIGGEGNPVIDEYLPKLRGKNMFHVAQGYEGNTGDGIMMGRDSGSERRASTSPTCAGA